MNDFDDLLEDAFDVDANPKAESVTPYRAKAIDGRWMYPVKTSDVTLGWGRQPLDWLDDVEYIPGMTRDNGFLLASDEVTALRYISAPKQTFTHWQRDESPMAAQLPETIAADKWDEFAKPLGYDEDDEYLVARFYTRQYTETPGVEKVFRKTSDYRDLPIDLTDLDSAIDTLPKWSFQQNPAYLVFGQAFAHALPGTVSGIRLALAEELDALPGVKVWPHKVREGVVEGNITLSYEDNRTSPSKVGRRTVVRTLHKDMPFSFHITDTAGGKNKADAVKAARKVIDEHLEIVKNFSWAVCSHCDGHGVVKATAAN